MFANLFAHFSSCCCCFFFLSFLSKKNIKWPDDAFDNNDYGLFCLVLKHTFTDNHLHTHTHTQPRPHVHHKLSKHIKSRLMMMIIIMVTTMIMTKIITGT